MNVDWLGFIPPGPAFLAQVFSSGGYMMTCSIALLMGPLGVVVCHLKSPLREYLRSTKAFAREVAMQLYFQRQLFCHDLGDNVEHMVCLSG